LLDTLCAGFVLPHTTTTVVRDWTKGRHREVDDVNGLVVAELARHGSSAPVNAAIVEVAHRIERGDRTPGRAILDLLRHMLGFSEATDEDQSWPGVARCSATHAAT
jgi:2-dehydropantoate 2-reductase